MRNTFLTISSAALLAGTSLAQSDYNGPSSLLFVMDNTVELNSTYVGDGAVVSDDAVLYYSPGGMPFALPYCDYGTWCAFFGDDDNDAQYGDSTAGSIDALWVPLSVTNAPASFFDVYFSMSSDIDVGGFLGTAVTDGDIIKLSNNGTTTSVETLISQAQIITAANSTSSNVDVDGFTVDPATNDFYFSFTAGVNVNGTTLQDGGIMRIPGSALTFTGNVVTAVTAGSAEIVITEAELDVMFINAGYTGVNDICAIEIDPTGGTFTSTVTNLTMPHFWLANDDDLDEGFCSTKDNPTNNTAGVIPSVNGVPLFGPNSLGLKGGFQFAFGHPWALAFQPQNTSGLTPMHLDSFPVYAPTTPATFNVDVTGATPNAFVAYFLDLEVLGAPGLFPSRFPISPIGPIPAPGWNEFYPNIPSLGLLLVQADPEGFGTQPISIPAGFPGLGAKMQCADLTTLTLSAPILLSWN
ncbi:MAG: hypothetical protein NXI31_16050 [bacterium]|nr:hypothetical protein [bacterium]